jgi:hypothetical protein
VGEPATTGIGVVATTESLSPAEETVVEGTTVVATAAVVETTETGVVVAVSSPVPEQATTTRPNSSHLTRFNPLPSITPGYRS